MKNTELVTITKQEYDELKAKAVKWDAYITKITKHLPNNRLSSKERSELARKAVQARWANKKN